MAFVSILVHCLYA